MCRGRREITNFCGTKLKYLTVAKENKNKIIEHICTQIILKSCNQQAKYRQSIIYESQWTVKICWIWGSKNMHWMWHICEGMWMPQKNKVQLKRKLNTHPRKAWNVQCLKCLNKKSLKDKRKKYITSKMHYLKSLT